MRRTTPFASWSGLGCALVVAGASSAGCYSKATAYEGKLTFAYASGIEVENFVKPIAPGAKLDVVAFENGTDEELVITKATSSRPGVLAVDAVAQHTVTLRGVKPGVADVEITARDRSGRTLVDKMFFHVGKPTSHALEHACTEEPEAAYVRGADIDIFHTLATADRRPVIGYGYAPVRVEPSGALELTAQPQASALYRFRAPKSSARVTLRSTVDETALTLRIVEPGDLTEARLDYAPTLVEGESAYAVASVTLGQTTLCSQNALTKARSLTPEVCKVTAGFDDDPGQDANRDQLATITALAFGECRFEITLPELAGGRGVTLTGKTRVGRVEYPRSGDVAAPSPAPRWTLLGHGRATWTRLATWFAMSRLFVLGAVLVWLRRKPVARGVRRL